MTKAKEEPTGHQPPAEVMTCNHSFRETRTCNRCGITADAEPHRHRHQQQDAIESAETTILAVVLGLTGTELDFVETAGLHNARFRALVAAIRARRALD